MSLGDTLSEQVAGPDLLSEKGFRDKFDHLLDPLSSSGLSHTLMLCAFDTLGGLHRPDIAADVDRFRGGLRVANAELREALLTKELEYNFKQLARNLRRSTLSGNLDPFSPHDVLRSIKAVLDAFPHRLT
jgi:hypothetical protein